MERQTRKIDRANESGVSLVELLVVIIIIAVVASLALMQRGSANEQFQRQNASRELKVAFERARFDSVKRRAVVASTEAPPAYVSVEAGSFSLVTYTNEANGTAVAHTQTTSTPSGVIIARHDGGSLSTAFVVTFDMRGETSQSPAPQFYVCNVTCSSPSNSTADIVLVTPTGTVNLLGGSSAIPTFTNPTLAGSNSNTDGINPDVVLP